MTIDPTSTEGDPGLQPERTALAWQRTGLALVGITLIISLNSIRLGLPLLTALSALLAIALVVVAMGGFPRGKATRSKTIEPVLKLAPIVALTVGAAVLGAIVSVLGFFAGG